MKLKKVLERFLRCSDQKIVEERQECVKTIDSYFWCFFMITFVCFPKNMKKEKYRNNRIHQIL